MRQIIAFGGKKGSGKDTCIRGLRDHFNKTRRVKEKTLVVQVNFADKVRETCHLLFHLTPEEMSNPELKNLTVRRWPWQSPRYLMQRFATEAMRTHWPDIWIQHWKRSVERELVGRNNIVIVTSDLRFPNEREAVETLAKQLKIPFHVINIRRPETDDLYDAHESEAYAGKLGHHIELVNDGTPEELIYQLRRELKL